MLETARPEWNADAEAAESEEAAPLTAPQGAAGRGPSSTWAAASLAATVACCAGAGAAVWLRGASSPVITRTGEDQQISLYAGPEECSASRDSPADCGYVGITQGECEEMGCCYDDTNSVWCWQKANVQWECRPEAAKGDGGDCGQIGITQEQCEGMGCCYDESNPDNWCYPKTKVGESEPGSSAGGGGGGGGPSLFCFAVACSDEEHAVLDLQQARGAGMFACEEWKQIDGKPSQMGGGLTHSWTNVGTFVEAWKSVYGDGRWEKHDWTVKADPDTVWVPQRLRDWLGSQGDPGGTGAFVNNCMGVDNGFYGALEVFSKNAVATYKSSLDDCWAQFADRDGMGEDLFAQWCMQSKGVQVWAHGDLICNTDCGCDPRPCSTGRIAYHPFKGVDDHQNCLNQL